LTNQLQKLKTTGSFKKKLDAARRIVLGFFQFIARNEAGLRFSKLFEFRIVRFFYTATLCKRLLHQRCAKVGLIHKAFRQIGGQRLPFGKVYAAGLREKGLSKFSRTFLFLKVLVSLFLVFKSEF
jgi:hypothetical protein